MKSCATFLLLLAVNPVISDPNCAALAFNQIQNFKLCSEPLLETFFKTKESKSKSWKCESSQDQKNYFHSLRNKKKNGGAEMDERNKSDHVTPRGKMTTEKCYTVRCKETRLFGNFLYELDISIKIKNYLNVA